MGETDILRHFAALLIDNKVVLGHFSVLQARSKRVRYLCSTSLVLALRPFGRKEISMLNNLLF